MYKRIDHSNDEIEIQEHFRSPMVYLDHWALNDVSLNKKLRERFIRIMSEKGGTFRLSVFNMLELSKQTDSAQVNSIIEMIDSIPDCGLINSDPGEVLNKENALISDATLRLNPSVELDLVKAHIIAQNYPSKWHVSNIIRKLVTALPSKPKVHIENEFLKRYGNST